VSSLSFDDVMDLLGERPLALTFEHPWQKEMDDASGDAYYFNSHTDTSEWDRPAELGGVVASMREWKGKALPAESVSAPAVSIAAPIPAPVAAPAPAAATDAAAAHLSTTASAEVARSRPASASSAGIELDEDAADFKYAVRTRFSRPGKLGLEFEEDRDSGQIVVQHVAQGGTAEGLPHVCVGLILTHVAAGRKAEASVSSLSFDDVMDLLGERPLALTFEHPWQKEMDDASGDAYYFNSYTDTSEWDRPAELGGVVASMREWKGKALPAESVSAPAVSIAHLGSTDAANKPLQQWPPSNASSLTMPSSVRYGGDSLLPPPIGEDGNFFSAVEDTCSCVVSSTESQRKAGKISGQSFTVRTYHPLMAATWSL
jgi:hypothetical protein